MPIFRLFCGPKWIFRPAGTTCGTGKREICHEGPLLHTRFHIYRRRNVRAPKLSKFRILPIKLPLKRKSFPGLYESVNICKRLGLLMASTLLYVLIWSLLVDNNQSINIYPRWWSIFPTDCQ